MAVTVDSFRNAFDEFRKTDTESIKAKLMFAREEVNSGIWGDRTDTGVMYMTAHLLALSPSGQNAKLKPRSTSISASASGTTTIYLQHFDRIKKAVTFGFRIAGTPPKGSIPGVY